MTSKRRENINLVSFICLSFLVISFSKQLLIQWISVDKTNQAIRWIVIYSVDSVIHFLNNRAR